MAAFVGCSSMLKLMSERDALGESRGRKRVGTGCHGESKWDEKSSRVHIDVFRLES